MDYTQCESIVSTKWVAIPVVGMVDDTDESGKTEVRVNVRTTEQRRDRWKQFADEHQETRYMSDLIHRAVREYIQRHEGDGPRHGAGTDHGGGLDDETATALRNGLTAVQDVADRLDELERAVNGIDSRLARVEQHAVPDDDDVTASEIVSSLPPFRPETDHWQSAREFADTFPDDTVNAAWSGTVESVAEYHDVTEETVKMTLSHIVDTPAVEPGVVDGTTRYWSERSDVMNVLVRESQAPIPDHLLESAKKYGMGGDE